MRLRWHQGLAAYARSVRRQAFSKSARVVGAIALLAVGLPLPGAEAQVVQQEESCDVPELSREYPQYDTLVCEGVTAMATGEFQAAINYFERAMDVRFHEYPNFQLFSRLALAYWRAGHVETALTTLEKARLSLNLLIGVYTCLETDQGFQFLDDRGVEINRPEAVEVKRRMCDAIAIDYYGTSLYSIVRHAKLVQVYLEARDVVH